MDSQRIMPAYDGIDSDSAPESLSATKAPLLENFLVDRPGSLPLRGPLSESTATYTTVDGEKPVGIWSHNNNILMGLKAVSATAVRDPWVAPYRRVSSAASLASAATTIMHVNLETSAVTQLTGSAIDVVPGPRFDRVGDYVYGIGYDNATSSTQNGGVQKHTKLLRWDGTAAVPTAYANGPLMAQDVKTHLDRLFVLGGMVPGTTTYSPSSLFFSDPGGPTADTLAFWQDDDTGLINNLTVDSNDPSDFGVGLSKANGNLVMFKRHSIHVLYGTDPATFQIKTFTTEQGCIDARSIVEYEGGCFFMSDQGYMFFDGARLFNTSSSLRSTLLTHAINNVGDNGLDGGRVIAGKLPNGYIGLSIGVSTSDTTASVTDFSALYHVGRQAWVYFSSAALSGNKPVQFGHALTKSFVVDDTSIVQANYITAPETAPATERGADLNFTFDGTGSGPLFNGTGGTLKNQITGVEAFTGSPIPARWHSRLFSLGEPLFMSQLHRFVLDYTMQVSGAADDDYDGWYVLLTNGRGQVLAEGEYQVPAQGDPSSTQYAYRRQHTKDVFDETHDLQVRIEWRGTTALILPRAEIFNSMIEFNSARQRRST